MTIGMATLTADQRAALLEELKKPLRGVVEPSGTAVYGPGEWSKLPATYVPADPLDSRTIGPVRTIEVEPGFEPSFTVREHSLGYEHIRRWLEETEEPKLPERGSPDIKDWGKWA